MSLTAKGLNAYAKEAFQIALDRGWWDGDRVTEGGEPDDRLFAELMMLVVTECAEAVERWRKHEKINNGGPSYRRDGAPEGRWRIEFENGVAYIIDDAGFHDPAPATDKDFLLAGWEVVPDGIPSELADILIRVFDICGAYGVDIETAVREKMAFNARRPERHGGKRA